MGCVCCSFSSFVSIVLDALERISLCTVCAMLTCCLVFTIIAVMIMGIGIGYHYCVVQNSLSVMGAAAKQSGRSGSEAQGQVMRSVDRAVKRGFAHRVGRREADAPPPVSNDKSNLSTVVPLLNVTVYKSSYNTTKY